MVRGGMDGWTVNGGTRVDVSRAVPEVTMGGVEALCPLMFHTCRCLVFSIDIILQQESHNISKFV